MFAPTSHSFNQVYTLNLWSWLSPYVIDPAIQITWSTVLIFYIWDASQTGPKLTSRINSCHIFYAYSPLHILNISNSVSYYFLCLKPSATQYHMYPSEPISCPIPATTPNYIDFSLTQMLLIVIAYTSHLGFTNFVAIKCVHI